MQVKLTRDGKKNVVLMVWGEVDEELQQTEVLHPDGIKDGATGLKLDQIVYTIESGVKVRLGWSEDGLILPVEGRGLLNYYAFDSIPPSSPGQGLWVSATGKGAFHLVLDCTKMGV